MDKKKVIFQIGDLIEQNCHGCTINSYLSGDSNKYSRRDTFCNTECNIGKQLQELGRLLNNPNKELKELSLTKEDYLEMKKSGMTDKEIQTDSNLDHNKLYKLKGEWDLIGSPRVNSKPFENKEMKPLETIKGQKVDMDEWDKKSFKAIINDLKTKLENRDKEIENLNSKNKTLETNVGTLMDIRDKNVEEIQNLKSSLTTLIQELNRVKSEPITSVGSKINKENKALKAFVRVWLEEEQA